VDARWDKTPQPLWAGSHSRRSLYPFAIDTPPNIDCEAWGDRRSFKRIGRCDGIFYGLSVIQNKHFGNRLCRVLGGCGVYFDPVSAKDCSLGCIGTTPRRALWRKTGRVNSQVIIASVSNTPEHRAGGRLPQIGVKCRSVAFRPIDRGSRPAWPIPRGSPMRSKGSVLRSWDRLVAQAQLRLRFPAHTKAAMREGPYMNRAVPM
jgi:hypothetical protein